MLIVGDANFALLAPFATFTSEFHVKRRHWPALESIGH
jgi:hypothetical protein